jgi:carboxypeptidase PM20D1
MINRAFASEPSTVTSSDGYAYNKVDEVIKRTLPGVLSSPFLMIGGTDSRYFGEVSTGIIKFSPMFDPIGFHGINERISLDSYKTAIWFYQQLIKSTN